MRNLINIFLLLPLLVWSQTIPDKKYHAGAEISKTYHGGVEVWSSTPAGPINYYNTANAANSDNEVDAITGTSNITLVSWSSVATSPAPQNGARSLKMTHTGGTNQYCIGDIAITGLTIGETYDVKLYLNEVVGVNWEVYLYDYKGWVSTSAYTPITSVGTWTEYILTGQAAENTAYITLYGTAAADNGDSVAADNIRVNISE